MNQKAPRGIMFWVLTMVIIFILWNMMANVTDGGEEKLKFSEFMGMVENGGVESAFINSNAVTGKLKSNSAKRYKTVIPLDYPDFIKILRRNGVTIEVEELRRNDWLSIIFSTAPFIILIILWVALLRQQGGGKAFSFGKSRAKMFTGEKEKVTFKDVAGIDEAKDELQEIIDFLKEPKKFQRLGGRIPKGVLLVGQPGTGKTLLARAIAGEAQVPFFSISGSDFVELFVGVGASRVRDLFDEGKKHSPCLVFIDEIDAVGRQRGAGLGGGHDEREQTLNALLVEMDGFDPNVGIIIIAATNRPDILDTALLRPGRFDRRIMVSSPDVKGREDIFKVHTSKVPLSKTVNLKILARSTPGFTGADIANMVNEAALFASRKGKKRIEMRDFEFAKDKVLMGAERRSMIISEEEKRITAYHEGGHALVASLEDEADPLHKVSIIPRGMALGVTQQLPINDKYSYSKAYLDAQIGVLLAGRIAEEIFLNTITTGAGNDFEKATSIARQMVCEWGMSSLGPVRLGQKEDMLFLGREMMHHSEYSDETARKIDQEVWDIIDRAYKRTTKVIETNKDKLEKIALYLLERESLTVEEINEILAGKDLKPVVNEPEEPVKRKRTKSQKPAESTANENEEDEDDSETWTDEPGDEESTETS
ncbi:MAG: ATP-dependent metallopeptidase FtsH/Yme1/Tma family protein [bacterium]|nr:ATP-dependent metallopeptidase FtsH/Yme1/Tma family protein [bacterium]